MLNSLWTFLAKGMGSVPNLLGLTKNQARQSLQNAGFNYGTEIEEVQDNESLTGLVKSQDVAANTLLDYESTVNYKLHSFSFSPFGVFGFSPFGVFGFSPFAVFGFSPFGVFSFTPGPIECPQPGAWSEWSAWDIGPWGPWGECEADGYRRQHRTYTRTRTRTIYTLVSGNCIAGTETQTETMDDVNVEVCGTPAFNFMPTFAVFSFTPAFSVFSFTPAFSVFSFTPAFSVFSFTPAFGVFSFTPEATFSFTPEASFNFAPWG
ncbi:MAG: PASTA domain-containing protein [Oxalobacteraceae bacterium]|nr:PASTA domain-containing protein [Oxalobacteraceae bacterium]